MSAGSGGEGRKGGLDTLTKEELVTKCKSLLALAQKAKHAKDDLAKKYEALKEENDGLQKTGPSSEPNGELKTRIEELESQAEDLDDLVKAKQRKVERLTSENDDLVQQLDTYAKETRLAMDNLAAKEKAMAELKAKTDGLQKKAAKAMELEALSICSKETEKKLKEEKQLLEIKVKDEAAKLKALEDSLKMEKKLSLDKNQQIKTLSDKVEKLEVAAAEKVSKAVAKDDNELADKDEEINDLKLCIDQLESTTSTQLQELEALKAETTDLKAELEEGNSKILLVSNEKSVLESTNDGLIAELNELNAEIKKRGEKIGRMEQTIGELSAKHENGSSEALAKANEDMAFFQEKLTAAETENAKLNDALEKLREKSTELETENKEQDTMIQSQKKEIDSLDFELGFCQEKLSGYAEKVVKLEKQHKADLQKANAKIKQFEEAISESNTRVEKHKQEFEAAKQEVDSLKDTVATKNSEISKFEEDLNALKQDAQTTIAELNATKEALDDLSSKLEAKEIEIKDLLDDKTKNAAEHSKVVQALKLQQEDLRKAKVDLEDQVKNLKDELLEAKASTAQVDFSQELSNLMNAKEVLEQEKEILATELTDSKSVSVNLERELTTAKQSLNDLRDENTSLKQETKVLAINLNESKSGSDNMIKELGDAQKSLNTLKTQNKCLESELAQNRNDNKAFQQQKETLGQEIQAKTIVIEELENKVKSLKTSLKSKDNELESMQTNLSDLTKQAQIRVKECDELTAKLQTLQTDLKTKTKNLEDCSKLKEEFEVELSEKRDNLDSLSQVVKDLQVDVEKKSKELEAAEKRIVGLNRELENIKSAASNNSLNTSNSTLNQSLNSTFEQDDSRSEIMSTSTVSRAEELNRMKDLEDSFEDRYAKLRLVAIKLKKKVADQAKLIADLEGASSATAKRPTEAAQASAAAIPAAAAETAALKDKLATFSKNFANLQSEYDQAVDKIDSLQKTVKALTKDLETTMAESINNKQSALDSDSNLNSLKAEVTRLQEKLKASEIDLSGVNITLDQERKERKSLELRIQGAEVRENKLKDKTSELMLAEESITSLKQQVVELEKTLAKEQERGDRAQTNLASTREHLNKVEADLIRKTAEAEGLKSKMEESVASLEQTKEELAALLSRTERSEGEERSRVAILERQLNTLENRIEAKSTESVEKEEELERTRKEFENYKVRAQSVLKQAKESTEQESRTKKRDEILAMEKINDALQDKIRNLTSLLKTSELEKSGLQEEHDRLMERQSLLLQELAGKEKSWRSRLEEMEQKERKLEAELGKGAEKLAQETEQLNQKLQQELELARTTHGQEIGRLKTQLDVAENEIIRLEFVLQKEQEARKQAEDAGVLPHQLERERIDISQMEREAAEGQEVEPSGLGPSHTSPLPLEQLLALSEQSGHVVERQGSISRQSDRTQASSRQGGPDRQVANLSVLLSESEAQNARLEKLTEILKEEIRIYQRSEERHKHIENLEYVKNIILKFVTLQGEERGRLVPVLQTILKLSKEEVNKLQQVAKVEGENSGSGGEGWGSYLGLGWSTSA